MNEKEIDDSDVEHLKGQQPYEDDFVKNTLNSKVK